MTTDETIIDLLDNILERLSYVEERTSALEEAIFDELKNL
jgi:hypothetical protein